MGAPTVISLFAGCGGSSLGYRMAGFRELLAVDSDALACGTFRMNFPDVPIWQRDVRSIAAEEVLAFCGIGLGELDVLDGSPPCQGFSLAGRKNAFDSRNDLFREYVRLLRGLRPKAFVMENVGNMVRGRMRGRFREITSALGGSGYGVSCRLMDAQWYGVPQRRRRLIWIGVRDDLGIPPSHPRPQSAPVAVWEALKGLPLQVADRALPEREQRLYWGTRRGCDLSGAALRILGKKDTCFTHWRLGWNRPAPTVCAARGSALLHPDECRQVTLAELRRLCSFPDSFILAGGLSDGWRLLGNSVPPLLMAAIAGHVKREILDRLAIREAGGLPEAKRDG